MNNILENLNRHPYLIYTIRQIDGQWKVAGWRSFRAAEAAFCADHGWEKGEDVAAVTSLESARAVIPTGHRRVRLDPGLELWL